MGLQSPIVRGLGAQNVERGFNLAPRRGPPHKLTKSGRFCAADPSLRIHLQLNRDCRGRPSSMYMWCPHDVGRESWVWEEHEAV